ncbi:nuclear transport factor 2 family protein [Actinomadura opuntiae]|uniref:nuclear transport factor 2 family protein n=1 Tax=Actinomadura sp. OS1-43 TaxID=604315 RepID=UPI00255AB552|nr:nuclear transport factor 2 family protein [Actinomadura sp. OS1-43]MDL4816676.1 nuclear transport factor 2 family protein [Actinomadura sp. OS1-43]
MDNDALTELVGRLGRWLDDKLFDDTRAVFTEDAEVTTPGGTSTGADALAAQARRNHTVPTQHFITNPLIEVDGDRAAIDANLLVVFANDGGPRVLGERYALEAARTPDGWRISKVRSRVVWELPAA